MTRRGGVLSYISANGLSEDVDKRKTIGSGETPASVFLNSLNPNQMHMRDFAKWGYFIIKHIEENGINDTIGVGGYRPQVCLIPNEGQLCQAENDFLDDCENTKTVTDRNFKNLLSGRP